MIGRVVSAPHVPYAPPASASESASRRGLVGPNMQHAPFARDDLRNDFAINFCPNCGKNVVRGARFCVVCGVHIARMPVQEMRNAYSGVHAERAGGESTWSAGHASRRRNESSADDKRVDTRVTGEELHVQSLDVRRHAPAHARPEPQQVSQQGLLAGDGVQEQVAPSREPNAGTGHSHSSSTNAGAHVQKEDLDSAQSNKRDSVSTHRGVPDTLDKGGSSSHKEMVNAAASAVGVRSEKKDDADTRLAAHERSQGSAARASVVPQNGSVGDDVDGDFGVEDAAPGEEWLAVRPFRETPHMIMQDAHTHMNVHACQELI
jgi:hypothetical protein